MKKLAISITALMAAVCWSIIPAATTVHAEQNINGATGYDGLYADNTFYVYLKKGERLKSRFRYVNGYRVHLPGKSTFAMIAPKGELPAPAAQEVVASAPIGTEVRLDSQPAQADGVWRIVVKSDLINGVTAAAGLAHEWVIGAYRDDVLLPGRVWTTKYTHNHESFRQHTFSLWYINNTGYKYKATYRDYNGYSSIFQSNSVGISAPGTCLPIYKSVANNIWKLKSFNPGKDVIGEFSDNCHVSDYNIFFVEPADDLPEYGTIDNKSIIVHPKIKPTEVKITGFHPDVTAESLTGELRFAVRNYSSAVKVQVDVDNNGSFADAIDREILYSVQHEGDHIIAFNGKDGKGNDIPKTATIRFRVVADKKGEIHFGNTDVEYRSKGIEVERLNGSSADRFLLFFDDSQLSPDRRCTARDPQVTSGDDGISSAGGVHGWRTGGCARGDITWGDNRTIDDWTWDTGLVEASLVYTYKPVVDPVPQPTPPTLPHDDNARSVTPSAPAVSAAPALADTGEAQMGVFGGALISIVLGGIALKRARSL